jgi:hypothetical protein
MNPSTPNEPEDAVCVTALRHNFASHESVTRERKELRVKSKESLTIHTGEGEVREKDRNGDHDVEQTEFRWMQEFFVRGHTLAQTLIEIKQLPSFQERFRQLTGKESTEAEKSLMRKLIRARDSVEPIRTMVDQAKAIPEEALPLPVFDSDTRKAAALFELASKPGKGRSFEVPMSAVALLLDCAKEEARRTVTDLIKIPFIKLTRKGKGNQSNRYKLIEAEAPLDL